MNSLGCLHREYRVIVFIANAIGAGIVCSTPPEIALALCPNAKKNPPTLVGPAGFAGICFSNQLLTAQKLPVPVIRRIRMAVHVQMMARIILLSTDSTISHGNVGNQGMHDSYVKIKQR
jgi:hypothetical protein